MTHGRASSAAGFTLLEIMVVLFIVSLVALLIAPKLSFRKSDGLAHSTRLIVREIRDLQWKAISTQRMVRLEYDLDRGRISASELAPSGNLIALSGPEDRPFRLPKGVRLSRIAVLHEGKVRDGKTFTQFFPSGAVESTTISLRDSLDRRMTVVIRPITGRIRIYKGDYQEKTAPSFYGPPSGEIPSLDSADDQ